MGQIKGGYAGKIVRIDLTKKSVVTEQISDKLLFFIGGRGWGAWELWHSFDRKVDAFSPQNKIIVSTGPLTGVLGGSKLNFSSISPATSLYGDSNVGSSLGIFLKRAGYDALIIQGKARKKTLIHLTDGHVDLEDAGDYWGMGCLDAERALRKDLGGVNVVIGPAGENLVRYACVHADFGRQAGRCGIGAVFGSKNLKAIVVDGHQEIPLANRQKVSRLVKKFDQMVKSSKEFSPWVKQGTMLFIRWSNTMSCLPTKNFSQTTYELAEHIGGDYMEKRTKRGNKGCWGCPVRCGQLNRTEKISIEGPEYETTSMLGSNCGLRSLEDVIEVNWWCDQLGLDTISTGGVLAWAMECWERGLIDAKITGGVELKFGNKEAMVEMVKRIAHRKGFGHLLAEGVKRASQRIGKGSDRFAMHVKGLEISGYDHRAAPAMALAYLTADIGAHHNRAWAITIDIAKGRDVYGEEFEPDPAFAGVKNKIEWVIYLQHVRPLFDCLGHCRFHWLEFGVPLGFYPEVLEAATGLSYTLQELLRRSEAVWNLTRLISLRQGLKASDEQLPKRVFTDPIPCGPFKGYVLDKKKFRQMVQTYYRLRGWNEQGVPAREKLVELGLE